MLPRLFQSLKLTGRRCPELNHLELATCPLVTGLGVGEIFANCPNLSLLNFASCPGMSSLDFTLPNGVAHGENTSFLQLHYIDLSECLVDDTNRTLSRRGQTNRGWMSRLPYCPTYNE